MRSRVAVLCGLALLLAAVPCADASRRPTKAEARAIRAAALRTLDGKGWRVSGIRVSTARTRNRYAGADVELRPDGPGGLMILGTRRGRWRRIFLGTDDFCDAAVPRAVLADLGFACSPQEANTPGTDLTVAPVLVVAGGPMTVRGSGFARGEPVVLSAGPPQSEADPMATVDADASGRITWTGTTSPQATPGPYVAVACQRQCDVKATAPFRIVTP